MWCCCFFSTRNGWWCACDRRACFCIGNQRWRRPWGDLPVWCDWRLPYPQPGAGLSCSREWWHREAVSAVTHLSLYNSFLKWSSLHWSRNEMNEATDFFSSILWRATSHRLLKKRKVVWWLGIGCWYWDVGVVVKKGGRWTWACSTV